MKTQVEQIKAAKRAYVMPINQKHTRFCIYLDSGNGLQAIWPEHTGIGEHEPLLPYQIYYRNKSGSLPAYHFHLTGYGYDRAYELVTMLRQINPAITIFDTSPGWTPRER